MRFSYYDKRKLTDRLMFGLTAVFTLLALSILFFILGYIIYHGVSSLNWKFLTELPKPVGERGGGIANAIMGSLKVVGLAGLIGIPVGIIGATYLAEFGDNRIGFAIRYCADIINGIPSIVVGIFAYSIAVLPFRGFSALAGSIALAIILIPLVLRNTEEFIRLVPSNLREAGLALGVPQWKVILKVVIPTASRGIVTSAVLGISRIAGETAPLLFTAFGNRFWGDGWFHPIATLPLTIFSYAISPYDDWHKQAWAAALILMIVVLAGNIIARVALKSNDKSLST